MFIFNVIIRHIVELSCAINNDIQANKYKSILLLMFIPGWTEVFA